MEWAVDPRQVEKAGNQKWEENLRFRQWLKTQNLLQVADGFDRIGHEVAATIDCTQCGNCCKGLTIAPQSRDIRNLAESLALTPFEFKSKYLKKDLEGDLVFKQHPCPFLKSGCCSVYAFRPETCRSYPHLEKNHMSGRGWHIVENTLICPIVYITYEILKAEWKFQRPTATAK